VTKIRDVFARDDTESLDILLNDLTLGDQTSNHFMRHIIAASGADQNCPPQFMTILKDSFLKALPAEMLQIVEHGLIPI